MQYTFTTAGIPPQCHLQPQDLKLRIRPDVTRKTAAGMRLSGATGASPVLSCAMVPCAQDTGRKPVPPKKCKPSDRRRVMPSQ